MKKIFRILAIVLTLGIVALMLYVVISFPPIMRGMAAKTLCSCVFVMERSPESVTQKELQVFPGLADVGLEIDREDSTVTARLLWQTSKAIFRRGLGCTLLAEAEEEAVRAQKFILPVRRSTWAETLAWPAGDQKAFADGLGVNQVNIENVIQKAFIEKDPEHPVHSHAVLVVYRGKIIGEKYAEGFSHRSIFAGWSMTKSITNALIGILVDDGMLSLEDPAPVEEWRNDARREITLNHLLQASSGLKWSESYFLPGADFHSMFIHSDDKAGYALSRTMKHTPGEFFEYSSGTTNILSKIIRRTVGDEAYHRFPYERLFSKIGMHLAILEPDASGTFVASSYGHARARDWARLGMLYLQDGVWEGERILPEGWVKYSTTPAPAATRGEYGAQIWLNAGSKTDPEKVKFPGLPNEAILFSGFEENYVVIIPSKDLVVVRLGVTHNNNFDIAALVTDIMGLLPQPAHLAANVSPTVQSHPGP